eukprot:TRINITY_DN4761_c0_g1_i1.p1 TRINITY_DN4761_c0_g1~~TRINITY_DN4761_c0_g1_i1.p1  ORF type:complete len:1107 (+),score=245.05 TRINITY_DN4761_c0_g1_i1:183-3503(+)
MEDPPSGVYSAPVPPPAGGVSGRFVTLPVADAPASMAPGGLAFSSSIGMLPAPGTGPQAAGGTAAPSFRGRSRLPVDLLRATGFRSRSPPAVDNQPLQLQSAPGFTVERPQMPPSPRQAGAPEQAFYATMPPLTSRTGPLSTARAASPRPTTPRNAPAPATMTTPFSASVAPPSSLGDRSPATVGSPSRIVDARQVPMPQVPPIPAMPTPQSTPQPMSARSPRSPASTGRGAAVAMPVQLPAPNAPTSIHSTPAVFSLPVSAAPTRGRTPLPATMPPAMVQQQRSRPSSGDSYGIYGPMPGLERRPPPADVAAPVLPAFRRSLETPVAPTPPQAPGPAQAEFSPASVARLQMQPAPSVMVASRGPLATRPPSPPVSLNAAQMRGPPPMQMQQERPSLQQPVLPTSAARRARQEKGVLSPERQAQMMQQQQTPVVQQQPQQPPSQRQQQRSRPSSPGDSYGIYGAMPVQQTAPAAVFTSVQTPVQMTVERQQEVQPAAQPVFVEQPQYLPVSGPPASQVPEKGVSVAVEAPAQVPVQVEVPVQVGRVQTVDRPDVAMAPPPHFTPAVVPPSPHDRRPPSEQLVRLPPTARMPHPSAPPPPFEPPPPAVKPVVEDKRPAKPFNSIFQFGIIIFILSLALPIFGAVSLLLDENYRFWLGFWEPVLTISYCLVLLIVLIMTLCVLDSRAAQGQIGEHVYLLIVSTFTMLLGLVLVLNSFVGSGYTEELSSQLLSGCSSQEPAGIALVNYGMVLATMRSLPACAAEASVEQCQGWKENRYTSYLRYLEDEFQCGPMCTAEPFRQFNHETWKGQSAEEPALLQIGSSAEASSGIVATERLRGGLRQNTSAQVRVHDGHRPRARRRHHHIESSSSAAASLALRQEPAAAAEAAREEAAAAAEVGAMEGEQAAAAAAAANEAAQNEDSTIQGQVPEGWTGAKMADGVKPPPAVKFSKDPTAMKNAQPYWGGGRTHGGVIDVAHVKAVCSVKDGSMLSAEYPCKCGATACTEDEICYADRSLCKDVHLPALGEVTRGRGVPGAASGIAAKLFSEGTTRMTCFPLIATRLNVLSFSSHELPYYQGLTMMWIGLGAAVLSCTGAFNKEPAPRPRKGV